MNKLWSLGSEKNYHYCIYYLEFSQDETSKLAIENEKISFKKTKHVSRLIKIQILNELKLAIQGENFKMYAMHVVILSRFQSNKST